MKIIFASIAGAACVGVCVPLFFISAQGTHVVINEIRVGGEKATDEFVELYNPTDADVNVTGWRLSKKTASGSLSNLLTEFPSVTIPAYGFILIAHNDYAGNVPKDLSYSTQSSVTADNTVILYSDKGQTIVDLVGMGTAGEAEGSAAPSPDPGMSIERSSGVDTNINAADFSVRATPTPKRGEENPAGEPSAPNGAGSGQGTQNNSPTQSPTSIIINELLPNPQESDEEGEWIELVNLGDQEVNLTDWALEDASGKHFTMKQGTIIASTTIAPKGYFLLPRSATGIALNNTGTETLTLLNPSEQTIVSISYTGPAGEGYSWARNADGNFVWTTTPTPSASNVITQPEQRPPHPPLTNGGTEERSAQRSTASPAPSTILTVVINELLPNPAGNDTEGEWIELKNIGNDEATLAGITISDESGARYTFTTQQNPMPPQGILVLPRSQTKIVLNNDGDTITLSYKEDQIAKARYGKSEESMSIARDENGNYAWTTTPTPGAANTFSLAIETDDVQDNDKRSEQKTAAREQDEKRIDAPTLTKLDAPSAPSTKGFHTTAIDALRELPRETEVSVEGIVIAPPGVFGKTTFYINGIQIYSVALKFPELAIGDRVQVNGYMSASGNETRITVPKTGSVKRIGKGEAPEPMVIAIESIGELYEGKLIRIEGELVEKKSAILWLDDDTGELRAALKEGSKLSHENFTAGKRYAITGVLSETASGYRILPRGEEDIEAHGEVRGISASTGQSRTRSDRPLYYFLASLSVLAIAAGLAWRKWKEHRLLKNSGL